MTMGRPTHIQQPGPAHAQRVVAVPCAISTGTAFLEAGQPLLQAVHRLATQLKADGLVLLLKGGALGPFSYVMPALARNKEHAAFYSAPYLPSGQTHLIDACLTFGERDMAPFFHCHGLWHEEDGKVHGGHMLPEATTIAAPIKAEWTALHGATFRADPDPETGFTLFGPVAKGDPARGERRATALRLRPNIDFLETLEQVAAKAGFASASLRGGVGSLIGAAFADGRVADPFATEVFIRSGHIEKGKSESDIAFVNYKSEVHEGRIVAGDNPVLMTFELVMAEG